ncbi:MAG: IS66 family transposase zinc-finger binding domain-containing protein [Cetobacterium sp.]
MTEIKANTIKSRQIFDIPEIKINVTEFRDHSKTCPHCHAKTTSEFPKI